MRVKRIVIRTGATLIAVMVIGASLFTEYVRRTVPVEIDISAEAAIIVDAKSGEVLYEKNADLRLQPASTVKIMTAIVADENMSLDEEIVPSGSVTKTEPTHAGIKPGVAYKLKDLISAMLIKSGNDAARAVAEGVAGSEENFVLLMNHKAVKLGMENTNFTSASGLPAAPREKQYTTARDLSKMMRCAAGNRFFLEEMSKREKDIRGSDGKTIHLATHNKSLFSEDGGAWGKTGYTLKAKRTFAGTDPSLDPKIIIAILKSNALWEDIAQLKKKGLEIRKKRRSIPSRIIDFIMGK